MTHLSRIVSPRSTARPKDLSLRPPNRPWIPVLSSKNVGGYLCFYFSDDLSALPVRWVTKPGDNKSDPNLETGTYGLFSTCNRAMRAGVVNNGNPYIFFVARRCGTRVLSGYYHIGWYAQGILAKNDFCLAADKLNFINPPVALVDIDRRLGTRTSTRFRLSKYISPEDCSKLLSFIDSFPDTCAQYLAEIDRLERFNLKHGGFRYIAWQQEEKFSWDYARKYLGKKLKYAPTSGRQNSATGDLWRCLNCGKIVQNKALLKLCPYCKEPGALLPARTAVEHSEKNVQNDCR